LHDMTSADVAKALGVSSRTVRGWIVRSNLPARKIGSRYRILSSDLVAWLERRGWIR